MLSENLERQPLLLGAIGVVATLRRPTLLRAFLIWDFALSLAVYSWANERFSWLVLHPLLPLLLLAVVVLLGGFVRSVSLAATEATGPAEPALDFIVSFGIDECLL